MRSNRSIPSSPVIPVLAYADVNEAASWLCEAFGFTVRLRIGAGHRVQMNAGDGGAVIVRERHDDEMDVILGAGFQVMIRVEDVDAHCQRAKEHGARITQEPTTHMYGERQYACKDFVGYSWSFSQSITDVDPTEWGGVAGKL